MPNIRLKRYTGASWEDVEVQTDWSQILNKPSTFTPTSHTHAATDIVSGTIATARLGSGTAGSSNFLRGDGSWSNTIEGNFDLGNSSGTTSDSVRFNTAQTYFGPQIRGKVQELYRDYYLSSYKIADEGNFVADFAPLVAGSLTELYTAGPTLVTASTATWTSFALGYSAAVGDKFLVIMSAGSNSSSIEKAGCIVEYGTFSSTAGMSAIGFFAYGGVSGTNLVGRNIAAQWQISGSNFNVRYPTYSDWNSTSLVAMTSFYIWKIYKVN